MRLGLVLAATLVAAHAAHAGTNACPARFDHFLRSYAQSEAVQRKATIFPLPHQTLDLDAQPEPKPVMRYVQASEAKYPLLPLAEERKREGLQLEVKNQTRTTAQVVLFKPDTGYRVIYYFTRKSCWRLQRIENGST